METVLRIQDLSYATPDGRPLAQKLNATLKAGQILWIRGDNGSGKSTLLRLLSGQGRLIEGSFDWGISTEDRKYLAQSHHSQVFLPLSLGDVIALQGETHNLEQRVRQLGLLESQQLKYSWNRASGGEQKRTLLSQIFLDPPRLLILDEPFNHLDVLSKKMIRDFLQNYLQGKLSPFKGSLILVSHENPLFETAEVQELKL